MGSGGVKCWGDNSQGQLGNGTSTTSPNPVDVIQLSRPAVGLTAGAYNACAILDNGEVQCWGYNAYGSLGSGTFVSSNTPTTVQGLSSGASALGFKLWAPCAVINGGVKCWGLGWDGLFGIDPFFTSTTPIAISGLPAGSGVTSIAPGVYHACALVNGGVKCWGDNSYGEVGDGTILPIPLYVKTPTLVLPF
jgi:alpha-tubulin suppressor-like RCC1 family protein